MNTATVWHGTAQEARELADAVTHNCGCAVAPDGACDNRCPAHALLTDQRALDGLVFARFMVDRLVGQEFSVQASYRRYTATDR